DLPATTPTPYPYTTLFRSPSQIVRDHVVENLLPLGRHELLRDRNPVRVADVFENLTAQRPLANRREASLELGELLVAVQPCVLRSEEHTSELQSREKLVCR